MANNYLTTEVIKDDFPDFKVLSQAFPVLTARVLGYLGKEAALELASRMERGESGVQFRDMDGNRKSRGGNRMITYSVARGVKWVRISSFPLNFFEGGRFLRSMKREGARNILRRTLRSAMSAKMSSALEGAGKLIIDDWFNEKHKGGAKTL